MSDIAIKVENLGKKYTLGGQKSAVFTVSSFCESITNLFSRNSKNVEPKTQNESTPNASDFWALKDINFEIKQDGFNLTIFTTF